MKDTAWLAHVKDMGWPNVTKDTRFLGSSSWVNLLYLLIKAKNTSCVVYCHSCDASSATALAEHNCRPAERRVGSSAHRHGRGGLQLPHPCAELSLAYLLLECHWNGKGTEQTVLFLSLIHFRSPFGPSENMVPCSRLPNGVPYGTKRVGSADAGGMPILPPEVLFLLQGGMAPTAPVPGKPNSIAKRPGVRGEPTEVMLSFGSLWHGVLALCLSSV